MRKFVVSGINREPDKIIEDVKRMLRILLATKDGFEMKEQRRNLFI